MTAPPQQTRARLVWPAVAGLTALVLLVYEPVRSFDFVNVDDQQYVHANPHVLRGLDAGGAAWAFTTFHAANWHPLSWLSHMADVTFLGPAPGPMHVVNVLLHLANALLLLGWLRLATGATWRSGLVAALFAVHPQHVESVAWISERKDLLSTLFCFLALLAWARHARHPRRATYLATLAALAAGLLAKPMVVTLPLLLLLLDAWPLGRLRTPIDRRRTLGLFFEKVPFLVLAALSVAVTILAQQEGGAVSTFAGIPASERVSNAVASYALYLVRTLWPVNLASFYPHPIASGGTDGLEVAGASALLAAVSWLALRMSRQRPYVAWGWAWYLLTLLPVIGLVQVGEQAQADRYTYVPLVGVFVAAVWTGADLLRGARRAWQTAARIVAGTVVVGLAIVARAQVGTWRDSVALHRHAIAVTERNWKAWAGLADAELDRGRIAEATSAAWESLRISPGSPEALNVLGVAEGRSGQHELALRRFEQAVQARPSYAEAWYNLGTAYGTLGDHRRAAEAFRRTVSLRPEDARAWFNLAIAYLALGELGEAADIERRLRRLDPASAARLAQLMDPSR